MKVTQFTSGENILLKEKEIVPAGSEMAGILNIEMSNMPIGKVNGYGVALTGSSCYELSIMDKEKRTEFLKSIYSKDGLGLTIARLTVGSCDYAKDLYTYDDTPFDTELKDFSIERDMEYIIPMIKEVLEINPDIKFYASPWSPPGWMKTGGCICGGYMRDQYIDVYADYIVKFIEAYKNEGINITALTPQNEPDTDQGGKSTACIWSPEQEVKLILALGERFEKNNLNVDIWFYDHNFSNWRRPLWMLDEYPEIRKYSGSIAFHYYAGGIEMIENIRKKHPDIGFKFTEGGPRLLDNYDTDWCKWSTMMSKALNHGFDVFTGWNLMLDETGGPNIGPFYCAGLVTQNSETGDLTYSGQYKALSHFSKFIENGADIYPCKVYNDVMNVFAYPNMDIPVEVSAVKNPDGKLILNIANKNKTKIQCQIYYNNSWWYFEILEDTISTIVFEN